MAETAFQREYRQAFIHGFEDMDSRLRKTVTTHVEVKGNEATFLVATSGSATAVTRGVNGLIAARADSLTQTTATLAEWHDLPRKTGFNVFASQGDQKRIMQETSMAVLNRKIDDDIIAQLDTATNDAGATALKASLDMVVWAKTILGNNFVDMGDVDNIFGLITPAFDGYLMQVKEYAADNYVEVKPFGRSPMKVKRWYGVNWIVHPRLTGSIGAGSTSASEQCYMFHRSAIGHAVDKERLVSLPGYNEEQDYFYVRTSGFFGSKLLQNAGVVMMKHDGSAYAAT